jgi:hypothetical protein
MIIITTTGTLLSDTSQPYPFPIPLPDPVPPPRPQARPFSEILQAIAAMPPRSRHPLWATIDRL